MTNFERITKSPEVLAELPESVRVKASNNCIKHDDIDEVFHDKNLATAALLLWLELKGVHLQRL